MSNNEKFYINGAWSDPVSAKKFDIIHPGNEEIIASISMGSEADVNIAAVSYTHLTLPTMLMV